MQLTQSFVKIKKKKKEEPKYLVTIIPYCFYEFKKQERKPFKLIVNAEITKRLLKKSYDIYLTKEENEKIWNLIRELKNQKLNSKVKFYNIPSSWSIRSYAFNMIVSGKRCDIYKIINQITINKYPYCDIKFTKLN